MGQWEKKMYKDKRGLWIQQVTINGKRKVFSAKSKKDLLIKISQYQKVDHSKTPLRKVADEWIRDVETRVSFNTMKGYSSGYKKIVTFWGDTPMEDITPQQVTSWINSYDLAQKTIKNILLVFRQIFDYAYVNFGVTNNPTVHIRSPKGKGKRERQFPSDDDIRIVNDNIDKPFGLMMYMALYTGLRRGELCALTWDDIDFDQKLIKVTKSTYWTDDHVPHTKAPKTASGEREVPLMDSLADLLKPLQGKPTDKVFGDLHSYQIDKGIRKYMDETGCGVTLHGLRHGFASILYKNNIDIKTAAYVLGHAQTSTTLEIYTHLMEQDKLRTVRNALNAV